MKVILKETCLLERMAHQGGHSIERNNVFIRALISAITVPIRYTFILNKRVILAKVLWESHSTCDFFYGRDSIIPSFPFKLAPFPR